MHTLDLDDFEWDREKAIGNFQKHGVQFSYRRGTCGLPETLMRKQYDFSNAKRGPVVREDTRGKTRISIRLDEAVLEWFKQKVDDSGGGRYQTLINAVLKDYIRREQEPLEATLRRVVREELERQGKRVSAR